MSLFSDILDSIGSERSPAPPPKPPARPSTSNVPRPTSDVSKPGSRAGVPAGPSPLNGVKRKAEDGSPKQPEKLVKPNPTTATASRITHRPAAPPLNAPKLANEKNLPVPRPKIDATSTVPPRSGSAPTTPTTTAPAKPPPKGSYAELMARAKQAQTDKAQQSQAGTIKHQATHREKVSKVAERKRQEEEKAKAAKEKSSTARPAPGGKQQVKSRSVSPAKKTDQPRVPKAPRPPLHAPTTSSYKGTMGLSSGRTTKPAPKRRRQDEYLGTDEEDNSDDMDGYEDGEEDGFSDASSDMEAGLDDMDAEEQRALRVAREEDARELALETRLKREKEQKRKQALQELAAKRKK
ncbi:hypothetical protein H2200_001717 [Cladophialophora chaetospira]|uniref:SPT2 chromatin protein n=1 Tax=Cladophialophora chaetospira TaxID=386627 RepID=A0AA38XLE4_9EURO|nr:hypothetical protein H2200_001717 [Cladophialophora chaetospira]